MKTECKKGRIIPKNIHEGPLKLMGRYRLLNEEDSANMGSLPNTGRGQVSAPSSGLNNDILCLSFFYLLSTHYISTRFNSSSFALSFISVFLGSFRLGSQVCPGSQLNHGRRETVGRRYETDVRRFRHELNECFPTRTQLGYEAMVGEMKINTRIKRSCSKRFRFSFLPPRGKPIFFFHFPFPRSFPQPVCLLNPFLEE